MNFMLLKVEEGEQMDEFLAKLNLKNQGEEMENLNSHKSIKLSALLKAFPKSNFRITQIASLVNSTRHLEGTNTSLHKCF